MAEVERCPRCGGELEHGQVYSARWIRWLPAGARAPVAAGQLRHEELLGVRWTGMRPVTAAARRCPACRVVEFDY